jgi:hypothetical protein
VAGKEINPLHADLRIKEKYTMKKKKKNFLRRTAKTGICKGQGGEFNPLIMCSKKTTCGLTQNHTWFWSKPHVVLR